ncbi:hypothetical protein [Polymorphospora rubra]|uniref:hypothetical protein n=1 Tax=Polymorphospora rubra TaxID=338584 RepID=UPI0033F8139E
MSCRRFSSVEVGAAFGGVTQLDGGRDVQHPVDLPVPGTGKPVSYGIGGRDVLSASTIGAIGHGRKPLTPNLLTGFAAFLGISSRDLSALTGIDL